MTVVTLVHGTWASRAAWCAPNSKLITSLRRALGPDAVIDVFQWSGGNTHTERLAAAADLQRHLRQCVASQRRHAHFLVGHSHGGSVCMYALRDVGVREHVTGTVTLATPFIVGRVRDAGAAGSALLVLLIAMPLLAMNVLSSAFSCAMSLIVATATMVAMLMLIVPIMRFLIQSVRSGAEVEEYVAQTFAFAPLSANELLIVRTTGDEASGVLAAAHAMSWIVTRLSRYLSRLFLVGEWLATLPRRLTFAQRAGLAAFMGVSGVWFWRYGGVGREWVGIVLFATAVGFAVPASELTRIIAFMIQVLSAAVLLPLILVLSLCTLPFGRDLAALSTLLDVSVESTPPGTYAVTGRIVPATGLSHSAVYDDDDILEQVGAWISMRRAFASGDA